MSTILHDSKTNLNQNTETASRKFSINLSSKSIHFCSRYLSYIVTFILFIERLSWCQGPKKQTGNLLSSPTAYLWTMNNPIQLRNTSIKSPRPGPQASFIFPFVLITLKLPCLWESVLPFPGKRQCCYSNIIVVWPSGLGDPVAWLFETSAAPIVLPCHALLNLTGSFRPLDTA